MTLTSADEFLHVLFEKSQTFWIISLTVFYMTIDGRQKIFKSSFLEMRKRTKRRVNGSVTSWSQNDFVTDLHGARARARESVERKGETWKRSKSNEER